MFAEITRSRYLGRERHSENTDEDNDEEKSLERK